MSMLNPFEASQLAGSTGVTKANYPFVKAFLLAIMGGLFVGFGPLSSIVSTSIFGPWGRLIGSMLFPAGLVLIVLVGGAVFTGNCLLGAAFFIRQITFKAFVRDLVIVWFGNLLGAVFLSFIIVNSNVLSDDSMTNTAIKFAEDKMNITFFQGVCSGFLCNILAAGAIWQSYAAKDTAGKITACWIPIMIFVYLGFQNIVANMTYLSIAKLLLPEIYSIKEIIITNFIPVSLGNFLSGGIFLPLVYKHIHKP